MSIPCLGCYPPLSGKKSPCTCRGKQPGKGKISSKKLTTVESILNGMPREIVELMLKEQQEILSKQQEILSKQQTSPVLPTCEKRSLLEEIYRRMKNSRYFSAKNKNFQQQVEIFKKRCGEQFLSENLDRLEFRVRADKECIVVHVMSRYGWCPINSQKCLRFLKEQLLSDPIEEIFDPNPNY